MCFSHIRKTSTSLHLHKKCIYCTHLHFVKNALGCISVYSCISATFIRICSFIYTLGKGNKGLQSVQTRPTFIHPFTLYPMQSIILSAIERKASTALLITVVSVSKCYFCTRFKSNLNWLKEVNFKQFFFFCKKKNIILY